MSGCRCLLWSPPLLPHDVSAPCTQVGLCWTGHYFGGEKYTEESWRAIFSRFSQVCAATLQKSLFNNGNAPKSSTLYLSILYWMSFATDSQHEGGTFHVGIFWLKQATRCQQSCPQPCKQFWTCRVATITERGATVAASSSTLVRDSVDLPGLFKPAGCFELKW